MRRSLQPYWLLFALATTACTRENPNFTGPAGSRGGGADASALDLASDTLGTLGAPCSMAAACASGFCADGVCCSSACPQRCRSCALPGSQGACTLAPVGADPKGMCRAEAPATCGHVGGCDGDGESACLLHAAGTECRPRSCSSGKETAPGLCDGMGKCKTGAVQTCNSATCTGDRCAVDCTTGACPAGFSCVAGRCQGGAPILHWRFDEEAGAVAVDSSGNGFTGAYRGDALPVPSSSVPRTRFVNPRSLSFGGTGRPAVELPVVASVLRPAPALTVSVWYRALVSDTNGSDLLNVGQDYILRLNATDIQFLKRRSTVNGMYYVDAAGSDLSHLDGQWHHVAAVMSATALSLYFDGELRGSRANDEPVLYRGSNLWVGRMEGFTSHDFEGGIDDLRIYNRDLSAAEIQKLAAGEP